MVSRLVVVSLARAQSPEPESPWLRLYTVCSHCSRMEAVQIYLGRELGPNIEAALRRQDKFTVTSVAIKKDLNSASHRFHRGRTLLPFGSERVSPMTAILHIIFERHGNQSLRRMSFQHPSDQVLTFDFGAKYALTTFLVLRTSGVAFVSCHTLSTDSYFTAYLKPVDQSTWTCIVVVVVVTAAWLYVWQQTSLDFFQVF